jgi:hypothetical protein
MIVYPELGWSRSPKQRLSDQGFFISNDALVLERTSLNGADQVGIVPEFLY